MLGVGLVLVLQIYVGGLQHITDQIDDHSLEEYDSFVSGETVQNLGSERTMINFSDFETHEVENCYFESAHYIHENYLEYSIVSPGLSESDLENYYGVECHGTVSEDQAYSTRILLANKTYKRPATIYIYEN